MKHCGKLYFVDSLHFVCFCFTWPDYNRNSQDFKSTNRGIILCKEQSLGNMSSNQTDSFRGQSQNRPNSSKCYLNITGRDLFMLLHPCSLLTRKFRLEIHEGIVWYENEHSQLSLDSIHFTSFWHRVFFSVQFDLNSCCWVWLSKHHCCLSHVSNHLWSSIKLQSSTINMVGKTCSKSSWRMLKMLNSLHHLWRQQGGMVYLVSLGMSIW